MFNMSQQRKRYNDCKNKDSKNKKFKYGNYNRYYGYRNKNKGADKRIAVLKEEWFHNKRCLDIGCNVGHVTLWIAKHFQPELITGFDIDCELIKAAKNNILNYMTEKDIENEQQSVDDKVSKQSYCMKQVHNKNTESETHTICLDKEKSCDKKEICKDHMSGHETISPDNCHSTDQNNDSFQTNTSNESSQENYKMNTQKSDNVSLDNLNDTCRLSQPSQSHNVDSHKKDNPSNILFPYNVKFITGNYAPASATVLKYVKEDYDVILCLSVTKWIQLNFGDDSLKWMFQKIYKQLRSQGKFILEPQPYESYKRRKNLSNEIHKNYDNMKFFPEEFPDYLMKEIGFSQMERFALTNHDKPGFQRPIYVFTK